MKKKLCVICDSPLLSEVVESVVNSAVTLTERSADDFTRITILPKRWGGCILPFHMSELDEGMLRKLEGKIRNTITESCIKGIAYDLCRDTRKKDKVLVGIGLVKKGQKFPKTGILIFWER